MSRRRFLALAVSAGVVLPLFPAAASGAPGDLDPALGGDGSVLTSIGETPGEAEASATVVQPDGKIVAAGGVRTGFSATDFALVRYNADGSVDTTFGNDGVVRTPFSPGSIDFVNGLALQPDGKIIAVGASGGEFIGDTDFAVARYTADGSLDTGFSVDGKLTTEFGQQGSASAVAVQADGKIVVGGGGGFKGALARYSSDGSLDSGFDGDGKLTTTFGSFEIHQ